MKLMNRSKAFTLVELVVVITVIAILAGLILVGLSTYMARGRDSQRTAGATAIQEALEKYYDKNGEYPSCADMTGSGASVGSLFTGFNIANLLVPGATAPITNSVQCGQTLTTTSTDSYQYIGDGSADCSGSGKCLSYALRYKDETDNTIKELDSRRTAVIATSGTPTLTASTNNSTSINASWNTISNATSYIIQTANKNDTSFTTPVATTTLTATSTTISGLAQGTLYNFRVVAQIGSDQTKWSPTVTATTSVDAPSAAPTISAAMSGSTAQATSGTAICGGGTIANYSFAWYKTSTATPGSWSAWSSASTVKTYGQTNASQANQYGFKVQALCAGPDNNSAFSPASSTATVVVPYSTPAAPGYAGPGSFTSGTFYIVNFTTSCPAGTSVTNGNYKSTSWDGTVFGPHPFGFNDWWNLGPGGGANVSYAGYYQCTNYYGTSPLSPSSYNVINVHP